MAAAVVFVLTWFAVGDEVGIAVEEVGSASVVAVASLENYYSTGLDLSSQSSLVEMAVT